MNALIYNFILLLVSNCLQRNALISRRVSIFQNQPYLGYGININPVRLVGFSVPMVPMRRESERELTNGTTAINFNNNHNVGPQNLYLWEDVKIIINILRASLRNIVRNKMYTKKIIFYRTQKSFLNVLFSFFPLNTRNVSKGYR